VSTPRVVLAVAPDPPVSVSRVPIAIVVPEAGAAVEPVEPVALLLAPVAPAGALVEEGPLEVDFFELEHAVTPSSSATEAENTKHRDLLRFIGYPLM